MPGNNNNGKGPGKLPEWPPKKPADNAQQSVPSAPHKPVAGFTKQTGETFKPVVPAKPAAPPVTRNEPGRLKQDKFKPFTSAGPVTPFSSASIKKTAKAENPAKPKEANPAVRFTPPSTSAKSKPLVSTHSEALTNQRSMAPEEFDDIDLELGLPNQPVMIMAMAIPLPKIADSNVNPTASTKTKTKSDKKAAMDHLQSLRTKLPSRRNALALTVMFIIGTVALYFIIHAEKKSAVSNAPDKPDESGSVTPSPSFAPSATLATTLTPTAAQTVKQTSSPTTRQTSAPTPSTPTSRYPIKILYIGEQPDAVIKGYVKAATERLEVVIADTIVSKFSFKDTMNCYGYQGSNEQVDGLLVFVKIASMDGIGGILGSAGPCIATTETINGKKMNFARVGMLQLDRDDLNNANALQNIDVFTHELSHILGVGTLWKNKLYTDENGVRRLDGGPLMRSAQIEVGSSGDPIIENTGGSGTADGHFKEDVYGIELMTGWVKRKKEYDADKKLSPLSILTARAFEFLGYTIDPTKTEFFKVSKKLVAVMDESSNESSQKQELVEHLIQIDPNNIFPAEPSDGTEPNGTDSSPKRKR